MRVQREVRLDGALTCEDSRPVSMGELEACLQRICRILHHADGGSKYPIHIFLIMVLLQGGMMG